MTLSETIRTLESLALQQQSVAMVIQNDVFKLNSIPNAKYAVFAYSQGQHLTSVSGDLATYRFTLFYIDRLTADKSNQTEIQSTGTQVLRNILTMMSELDFDVDSMPIQPFTQRFTDECAGVYCEVSIAATNGCGCMPGFTEMFQNMDKAIANTNAAAARANEFANHPPKIVEVDGYLYWAFWDETTQSYVTSEYNADSSIFPKEYIDTESVPALANVSIGQRIVTGVAADEVSADADTVTVNLTQRTRDTDSGEFGDDAALPIPLPAVSQTAAGIMAAADKIKLDNLDQSIADAVADAMEYTDGEIAKEASARESADEMLQQNINAEASTRESADATLQQNIDAEASAREAADSTLQGSIVAETARAEGQEAAIRSEFAAADSTLQQNINAETARASGQEAAIRSEFAAADATTLSDAKEYTDGEVAKETSARESADETLRGTIVAETARAAGEEAAIRNEFAAADSATLSDAKEYADGEVAKEATSRENADATLQQNIDAETARAEAQEAAIRSEFAAADADNLTKAENYSDNAVSVHNTSETAHIDIRTILASCTGLPTYDQSTYKLTFQTNNGQQLVVDFPIDKMDLRYNPETQSIEFDNGDGTVSSIPVSEFITEYAGSNGSEIVVSIGEGNVIQASLVGNSIDWGKLSLALQQKINDKADTTYVDAQISGEASAREAADSTLQGSIVAETARASGQESAIRSEFAAADATTLSDAKEYTDGEIAKEASARESADEMLQQNINAEASTRESADSTLQQNIDAEASAREAAYTALLENIDVEKSRAEGQEAAIRSEFAAADASTLSEAKEYADNDSVPALANASVGQSLLTTVSSPSVTAAADSATINLTKRTRSTATGQFVTDESAPIVLPVATQTAAGLMSAADKYALDGIPGNINESIKSIEIGAYNLVNKSNAEWVEAAGPSGGYKDGIYRTIDGEAIRGKHITFRVELKGEEAQATNLGYEIFIAFSDGTKRWIGRYGDISERGTFEKTYISSENIEDKEITEARIYPVFYSASVDTFSGKLYIRHEFTSVGNKLSSTWFPSYEDIESLLTPTTTTLVMADTSTDVMTLDETGSTSEAVKRIVVRPGDEVVVPAGDYDVVAVGLDGATANPTFPMDASITMPAKYASMLTWVGVEKIANIYRSQLAESVATSLPPGDVLRLNIHFQPTTSDGEQYNVFIDAIPFSKIE